MKTILTLLTVAFCSFSALSQQYSSCAFERLFNLKEGLSKEAAADSIKNIGGLALFNNAVQKNTIDAGSKNKTGFKETLIYRIDAIQCFKGANSKLQLEFIDNNLSKVYIQTEFARADYYEMQDNFNALRSIIKTGWEREKETKLSSGSLVSTGYEYSKGKETKSRADKISLQYINTKPSNGYGLYLLQLTWVNTNNSGVESIVY